VLQVILEKASIKGTLVITTDKVYTNSSKRQTFTEQDPLGGDEPYSASKAAIDIVVQSWAKHVSHHPLAIARAGNVIGGGDWAENRLLPDLIKAYFEDKKPLIRNPGFVRPWQHVLDCVNGYYVLTQKMSAEGAGGAWNFGPPKESIKTVAEVNEQVAKAFEKNSDFALTAQNNDLHESSHLMLDSEKALTHLDWTNLMNFERAVKSTVDFYKSTLNGEPSKQCMIRDITAFLKERNDENRPQG
jgi:CDP-glucose 4,6-dehydratase